MTISKFLFGHDRRWLALPPPSAMARAGQKRAAEPPVADEDEIVLTLPPKKVLRESNAPDIHNRRSKQTLLFVSIPRHKAHKISPIAASRSPSSDPVALPPPLRSRPVVAVRNDSRPDRIPYFSSPRPGIAGVRNASGPGTRRTSRTASRRSYVEIFSDSEEDDDVPTRSQTGRRRKKGQDEDSEFGEDGPNLHSQDEDLTQDEDMQELDEPDEASSPIAADDGSSDTDRAPKRRPTSRKATKPSSDSITQARPSGSQKEMVRAVASSSKVKGLDESLPPLNRIDDIFLDLTTKALDKGLDKCLQHLDGQPLRVATMCSGTESPLLALEMIRDSLKTLSKEASFLQVEHIFSAEIEAFKQAYIDRNFAPPVIFRDITEFIDAVKEDVPMAYTNYGGKVRIPGDAHILIAGTSCVDYSKLNNKQKGIADGGESGKTWLGAKAYCERFRPAIVIFENVVGADWDQMLANYRAINYACQGMLVDTKHYYLPQTRQRGYMVCFDKARANTQGFGEQWVKLMENFKRPASSPVSSYLLSSDQVVIRQQSHGDDAIREVDWSACELTQMDYRFTKKLGTARPFTHWQESGSMLPPENGNAYWFQAQVERVKDTIDCLYLRKALQERGGYDARFKTRIVDLSQNVYRNEDSNPFGIIGCITPSGFCFVSDACRVLTAEETLVLQGIPLSKISFTTETATQVQDMAGNAMSTTVVGSAILSALICGHDVISPSPKAAADSIARPADVISCSQRMAKVTETAVHDLDAHDLFKSARSAIQRCPCEGSQGIALKPLQRCRDCGHTTCTACGGNPKHNYLSARAMTDARILPCDFLNAFRSKLPLTLGFDGIKDLTQGSSKIEYIEAVNKAAASTFKLLAIRRTHAWTIEYIAPDARLELVIEEDHAAWRLFALPPTTLATNSRLRKTLLQPVATSKVTESRSLFDGPWFGRSADGQSITATVTSTGPKVPSWWARNEMPKFQKHSQPATLEVLLSAQDEKLLDTTISGVYHYLPDCGKACDSLYKRSGADLSSKHPLYLFLDPTRTGHENADEFVFSHNKDRLEYGEIRPVVARLEPQWRPWDPLDNVQTKYGITDAKGTRVTIRASSFQKPLEWSLRPRNIQLAFHLPIPGDSPQVSRCDQAAMLLECDWVSPANDIASDSGDHLRNKVNDTPLLTSYTWMFEAIRRQLPSETWRPLTTVAHDHGVKCTPTKPAMRWKLVGHNNTIKPYEDPAMAVEYERQMKARPSAIVLHTEAQADRISVKFGINFGALAHRAMARLPKDLSTSATLKWRLDTNSQASLGTSIPKFELRHTEDSTLQGVDVLMENETKLFPKQKLALAWMRAQEFGQLWDVEQAEEASVRQLGWHVELRAQAPIVVRGGICADHPGFGKTITSLALIHSELEEMDVLSDLPNVPNDLALDGLIRTAATLIVCPTPLVQQWVDEIQEKLGYRGDSVLWITKLADLSSKTIDQFKNAKIIVLNKSVLDSNGKYVERLANFIGAPGPAATKDRALSQWLNFAGAQIPTNLKILQRDGTAALRRRIEKTYKDHLTSDQFKAAVPSRRLRGKENVGGKTSNATGTNKGASATIDTREIACPLFEMFHFNRIIVDEFHDYESREYAAVVALHADKRWGLSGTPNIGDCYDVARIGELLGVPLRIGSNARGIMKKKNAERLEKDMTAFEEFELMRSTPSQALQQRIHEQAQEFLDIFARRNIMDGVALKYTDQLVPVSLDTDHRALNFELLQHLNSSDMRIKKGRKRQATERDDLVHRMVESSSTAEEALSKTAAFFERATAKNALSGLEAHTEIRSREATDVLEAIRRTIKLAYASERIAFDKWIMVTLREHLGDSETIADIKAVLKDLRIKLPEPGVGAKEAGGKKEQTTKLNALVNQLLSVRRSYRYLRGVQELVAGTVTQDICTGNTCNAAAETDLAVSALCGHVICKQCWKTVQMLHQCPAAGCSSTMNKWNLLWKSQLGELNECTPYGAKIEAVMDLLDEIYAKGDQAIVFVQFENQVVEMERALNTRNIPGIAVKSSTTAGAQIRSFRENGTDTVIVLNASDQTAAGSNLQNANHVIVLSPLLQNDQYGYESTMAQMIGRVRRHGQKKEIHVYRVLALNTIDVDILEQRERRSDALDERGAPRAVPSQSYLGMASNEPKAERMQLIRDEQGKFSLQPRSWLVGGLGRASGDAEAELVERTQGRARVSGYEDFSSLIKFSRAFAEHDE